MDEFVTIHKSLYVSMRDDLIRLDNENASLREALRGLVDLIENEDPETGIGWLWNKEEYEKAQALIQGREDEN